MVLRKDRRELSAISGLGSIYRFDPFNVATPLTLSAPIPSYDGILSSGGR